MKGTSASHLLATGALFSKWAIPKPASANGRIRGRGAIRPVKHHATILSSVRASAYLRSLPTCAPQMSNACSTFREELVPSDIRPRPLRLSRPDD